LRRRNLRLSAASNLQREYVPVTDVRVVLFDVMSTLVYDPYRVELPDFFELGLDELMARKHPTAWLEFERGDIDESTFADIFLQGVEWNYDALKSTLHAAYRYLDGVEEILDDLTDAGVTMYSLSNYPGWYELIESKLELSRFMPWRFVSCRTGVRKPDPVAYRNPVDRLGGAPGEYLFVDDRQSNCDGAEQVGMLTIRFEDAAQLRDELSQHGLLER
jgi:HAD superfamily hydrolase (TIGR01509 family)